MKILRMDPKFEDVEDLLGEPAPGSLPEGKQLITEVARHQAAFLDMVESKLLFKEHNEKDLGSYKEKNDVYESFRLAGSENRAMKME